MAKRGRPKKKINIEEKTNEVQKKDVEINENQPVEKEIQEESIKPEPQKTKEDEHPKEKLFNFYEAAKELGVNENAIKLWVEHGHLVSVRIGGIRMITNSSILACPFRRYR